MEEREDWSFLQSYSPQDRAVSRSCLEAMLHENAQRAAVKKGKQALQFFRVVHFPEIRRNLRIIRRKNRDSDTASYRHAKYMNTVCLVIDYGLLILLVLAWWLWPADIFLALVLIVLETVCLVFTFITLFRTEKTCQALVARRILAELYRQEEKESGG